MSSPTVRTSLGVLRGNEHNLCREYLGVAFGKPPVGPLRFAAPQPLTDAWTGEKDASKKGKWCPQFQRYILGVLDNAAPELVDRSGIEYGEDCLNLNVWTPKDVGDGKLPVLVWIHGGAFRGGSGSQGIYDGKAFASAHRVVLVGINYRLSAFGFLASKELTEVCGQVNLGLLDQIEALKWVKKEIAAFGGDPGNVTVFGESAGAISIHALLLYTRGLFHKAFLGSGTMGTHPAPPISQAPQRFFDALCAHLKIPNTSLTPAETIARLRSLPWPELHAASIAVSDQTGYGYGPVWDNSLITGNYHRMMEAGDFDPGVTSIVLGDVANEGSMFAFSAGQTNAGAVEKFSAAVVGGDPAAIAKMKEVYPPSPDPMDSGARIWDDYLFHGPTLVESRRFASSKVKVFNYRFTWAWTRTKGLGFGAHHTSELPLLFNQASVCTPFESYLAARFSGYLAAFAATGEPGDGWPEYSLSSPKVLEFQRDGKIRVNHEKEIKGRDDEGVVAMWYGLGVKKVGGWEVAVKKARL